MDISEKKVELSSVKSLSRVRLFATPWTVAHEAALPMRFPRQEYWSGLPFPSSRVLLDSGTEPMSHELAGGFFTTEPPGKPTLIYIYIHIYMHTNSSSPSI